MRSIFMGQIPRARPTCPKESNEWQRHYSVVRAIVHVFVAHEEQDPDQDMVHVHVSARLNNQRPGCVWHERCYGRRVHERLQHRVSFESTYAAHKEQVLTFHNARLIFQTMVVPSPTWYVLELLISGQPHSSREQQARHLPVRQAPRQHVLQQPPLIAHDKSRRH